MYYNDPDVKVLRVLLEKEDQQNKDDQEQEITKFNQWYLYKGCI